MPIDRPWQDTQLGQTVMPVAPLLAAPLAPSRLAPQASTRMYANAVPNRLNGGFASFNTSSDAELVSSLGNLRARSRALVRDAPTAKNAKRVIVNNVIHTGVKLQAMVMNSRGSLNTRVNDAIKATFDKWSQADSCHTGGELHFHDIERMAVGQTFEAGEIFIRLHRRPFGKKNAIPLALEVIEPERIVDGYTQPGTPVGNAGVRMGVESDVFRRPIAYWIREMHPGDIRVNISKTEQIERVPAADILHLKVIDRWPQTRGEPWMHAVAQKLGDMSGYSEAEIVAARGAANYLGIIETPEPADSLGEKQPDGSYQMDAQPGTWMRTLPGEKAEFFSPNRPNTGLDPFMRFMLREIASGVGVSYESLSRDYSQSNYSSTRLALLDDRDVWKTLQKWYIRAFRIRLHEEFMTAAMLANLIPEIRQPDYFQNPDMYNAAYFRPRGWSWIDPTKEVAAYKEAVKAGFTTTSAVVAATGDGVDMDDVIAAREKELADFKAKKLVFDISPDVYVPAETRGLMILDEDGDIVPAAEVVQPPAPSSASQQPISQPAKTTSSGKPSPTNKPGKVAEKVFAPQQPADLPVIDALTTRSRNWS